MKAPGGNEKRSTVDDDVPLVRTHQAGHHFDHRGLARPGSASPSKAVRGFGDLVASHSEGAQRVLYGTADAAMGLRVVASVYGLDLIDISTVRCDLVIPDDLLVHSAVRVLLDILQSRRFRKN